MKVKAPEVMITVTLCLLYLIMISKRMNVRALKVMTAVTLCLHYLMMMQDDESKSSKNDDYSGFKSTLPNDDARRMKVRAPEVMIIVAFCLFYLMMM